MKWIFRIIVCLICEIIPKKKNRIVFTSWFGTKCADNPKYIYEKMLKAYPKEYEFIWILEDISKLDITNSNSFSVKKGSLKAFYYCVTASITFFTHGYTEFSKYNLIKGSYSIQLWHGVPWKKIGKDSRNVNYGKLKQKIIRWIDSYDLYISSNESQTDIIKSSFNLSHKSKVIEVGQPRNNLFFNSERLQDTNKRLFSFFIKEKNIDINNQLVITYMPTFRDKQNNITDIMLTESDLDLIEKEINQKILFINKSHFIDLERKKSNASIIEVNNIDTQELLSITDILITDYSSCLFDFILQEKPVIQYLYDYDYYTQDDRGLYYRIDEVDCGNIVINKSQLIEKIIKLAKLGNCDIDKLKRVSKKFNTFENNESLNKLVSYIFNKC